MKIAYNVIASCLLFVFVMQLNVSAGNYGEGTFGGGNYSAGSAVTAITQNVQNTVQQMLNPGPKTCGDLSPGLYPPTIYAALPKGPHAIQIFFSPASSPVDHYVLRYGTQSTDLKWGIDKMDKETVAYTIELLAPSTTYHFQIRGGNGCAVGGWSNIFSASTLPLYSSNTIVAQDITIEEYSSPSTINNVSTDGAKLSDKHQEYTLIITVVDTEGKPVAGAEVFIKDETNPVQTNAKGIATLSGISKGTKEITIRDNDYRGTQKVEVLGTSDEIHITTTVKKEQVNASQIFLVAGALLLTVILFFWIKKGKRRR